MLTMKAVHKLIIRFTNPLIVIAVSILYKPLRAFSHSLSKSSQENEKYLQFIFIGTCDHMAEFDRLSN